MRFVFSRALLVATCAVFLGCRLTLARDLTFEDRVRAQEAIERVYWAHRIWPQENPQPKPPLEAVLTESDLRTKVEDYIQESNALEFYWHRPILAEQLQAEIDRMIHGSRDRALLRQLFEALGRDPYLIAECLARPILADRLIHDWYARDDRVHGELRARAAAGLAGFDGSVESLQSMGGDYREVTWTRSSAPTPPPAPIEMRSATVEANIGGVDVGRKASAGTSASAGPSANVIVDTIDLGEDEWTALVTRLSANGAREVSASPAEATASSLLESESPGSADPSSLPIDQPGPLREEDERFSVTVVLSASEDSIRTASVVWQKEPFDSWWSSQQGAFAGDLQPAASVYLVAGDAISSGGCEDDVWKPMTFAPDGRRRHTAVWTGSEMIVWGGSDEHGFLASGLRYDPATDVWGPASLRGEVPTARGYHTAVWTGKEMIVWGGYAGDNVGALGTGGVYDPLIDRWRATSVGEGAPSRRYYHTAVWTGTEMIIWGSGPYDPGNTGSRYDPETDTWRQMSTADGVPEARSSHSAVWTGREMIVWGGYGAANTVATGGRYDPASDSWSPTSVGPDVPQDRYAHTAVWTGDRMIVWGGFAGASGAVVNSGGSYDPSTDTWTSTSMGPNVPSPRAVHTAVWTGREMIVWGGAGAGDSTVNSGGRYDPRTDGWIPVSVDPNAPESRTQHTAVWTGREMLVWGGEDFVTTYNTGGRYDPSTDTWVKTSVGGSVPRARWLHSAVWTGTEMIVWGGRTEDSELNSGGRYSPATDSWIPTSRGSGVPYDTYSHTAIWTGTEMIVWGGIFNSNQGGRYDPQTDTWRPTSLGANVPAGRANHTAVWTGSRMIVWGGYAYYVGYFQSGGQYDPVSDTWQPTSTGLNVPSPRGYHAAVWTGKEMIVWGGIRYYNTLNTGARYDPSLDAWTPTSAYPSAPQDRAYHTSVWTGSRMIVWGGFSYSSYSILADGGQYDPGTDAWTPTSTGADTPDGGYYQTAVWTGREMILWGGSDSRFVLTAAGARYDPVSETWRATSQGDRVPTPRWGHTAVWTDSEMIVWGGSPITLNGGRYAVCNDRPPVADAGTDQLLECSGNLHAFAALDASSSTDPDSTPGTNDDISSFAWSEGGMSLASGEVVMAPLSLGAHDITLIVTDKAGSSASDDAMIMVRDTLPPTGGVSAPVAGSCFGPSAGGVTVADSFADICDPALTRTYDPVGGPTYTSHGDYSVTVTAQDSSGNAASSGVSFTIDLVAPTVTILPPAGASDSSSGSASSAGPVPNPGSLPFASGFTDSDDDGASGGVVHEVVYLDDCALYDGATYGNRDGLLSDETVPLDKAGLCRARAVCGRSTWTNPVLRVEASDCGGNVGSASKTTEGSFAVSDEECAGLSAVFLTVPSEENSLVVSRDKRTVFWSPHRGSGADAGPATVTGAGAGTGEGTGAEIGARSEAGASLAGPSPAPGSDAVVYDAVRGRLSRLLAQGGFEDAACVLSGSALPELDDAESPPTGEGFYYLARYRSGAVIGDYGPGSAGPRVVSACP